MTKAQRTTYTERIEIVQHCIENNYNYTNTSRRYGVSYQQVYRWVKGYEKSGVEALIDLRGRTRGIAMDEIEKVKAENQLLKSEIERLSRELELMKRFERIEKSRKAI